MLDDDLARKISFFFFFEREEILVAFDPIFLRLSSSVIEGTGDREIEGEKGRMAAFPRPAMQIHHVAWLGCKLTRQPPPVIAVHALKSARREYSSR